MKLTVGPLPSAVYWRRRGGVLGAVLVVVIVSMYACSGSGASPAARTASQSPTIGSTEVASSPAVEGSASPSAIAASAPPAMTGPCTDAEISLSATPEVPTVGPGAPVKLVLKIKNVSDRTCERDVGPDPQELFIQRNNVKLWSSDSCGAQRGADVRPFAPGQEIQFFVVWNGTAKSTDCASTTAALSGSYQVVGRLATKFSDPAPLTISGGS